MIPYLCVLVLFVFPNPKVQVLVPQPAEPQLYRRPAFSCALSPSDGTWICTPLDRHVSTLP